MQAQIYTNMAVGDFDIPALFRVTWGMDIGKRFDAEPLPDKYQQVTDMGLPLYKTVYGKPYFMWVKLGGFQLPVPTIAIDERHKWTVRDMPARDGSAKGYHGKADYLINIRGFCLGSNGMWPEEQIKILDALSEQGGALEIENPRTAMLGIEYATIMGIRWPETRGFTGVQAYELELLSDKPFTLLVEDK